MRISLRSNQGFTLVELLVVISIIGVLMSLTLPAVNSAREAGRRIVCTNNQNQIGKALRVYESTKNKFPGYAGNKTKASPTTGVSWAVALLPFLDDKSDSPSMGYREIFVCPSDPPDRPTDPQTSFVVNAGWDTDDKTRESGVCTSNTPDTVFNGISKINTFADGASQTILLTENLNAVNYNSTSKFQVGSMWVNGTTTAPELKVNGRWSGWTIGTANTAATDKNRARPSSFHPGGVNVVFCDTSTKFMREDIDYTVYRSIMTSSGGKNSVPADVAVNDSDITNQ